MMNSLVCDNLLHALTNRKTCVCAHIPESCSVSGEDASYFKFNYAFTSADSKCFASFFPYSKISSNLSSHSNHKSASSREFEQNGILISKNLIFRNGFFSSPKKNFRTFYLNDRFTNCYLKEDSENSKNESFQEDIERILMVDSRSLSPSLPLTKLDEIKTSEIEKADESQTKALRLTQNESEDKIGEFQSIEEQELFSATPAHPLALNVLYAGFFVSCFMEQLWRFAWPVVISQIHPSLFPIAVASFVIQFFIFIGGPVIGELLDSMPRVQCMDILSIFQIGSMLISAAIAMYALGLDHSMLGCNPKALVCEPWFILLVLASSVEKLTGLVTGVAIERDWVVHLVGFNREIALAKANSMLRRVELLSESAGPLCFGFLVHRFGIFTCLKISCVMMLISLPLFIFLIHFLDHHSCGALDKKVNTVAESNTDEQTRTGRQTTIEKIVDGFGSIGRGWEFYLRQAVLPASVAYVLLSFNAVLTPGSLMMSFLTNQGLDVSLIGMFKGACSILGYVATFISTPLIASLGVLHAGAVALLFQTFMLIVSVIIYITSPAHHTIALTIFLGLVVLSCLGKMTYEMVYAQIFQTGICESQANMIGMTELSLSGLAELCMLGVAMWMHDVKHFGTLASLSMASVLGATYIYCHWLANPNADQKKLFPNHQRRFVFPFFKHLFPSSNSIKQWKFQN